MTAGVASKTWGKSPWTIDFRPPVRPIPDQLDFAIIGGGFTGLATAACLRRLSPNSTVGVFESETIGAGASGHSGGLALAETTVGDMPGLGDVLAGLTRILDDLEVECDLNLPGAYEIGRSGALSGSPISWSDSGMLRVVNEVEGGTIDPGKLVSGLARAADRLGASIFEGARVDALALEGPVRLTMATNSSAATKVRAHCVLVATNALSLELSALKGRAESKFTLAVATAPLTSAQLEVLGLASGKPFYTVDLPYLWGRLLRSQGVVFGAGLIDVRDWRELHQIDIDSGKAAELIARLELRVRGLDPVLKSVEFTHWWGGPILIAQDWAPVFRPHPRCDRVFVLGAYAGQGVSLSVYLGHWAAEAMLGRRKLPDW